MMHSVVIATHNRAEDLRATLESLAGLRTSRPWEVVVADNNSTDATREVIEGAAARYPVPLRYVLERTPGRSAALNTAINASRGDIVLTTDDDVRVPPGWLDAAADALEQSGCGYVGGRVLPIWGGPRPEWLPDRPGRHWAVIALLDYGPEPFELGARMPLGVNMAFRREAFDRVGPWNTSIGRKAGTLLGQEVREWCMRARALGVRGSYAPGLVLRHIIPADRLTRRYFRRWFYWRGVSRALLYRQRGADMENPQGMAFEPAAVAHVAGVPRYLFRTAAATVRAAVTARVRGDVVAAFEHELWLWMFVGIIRQRWRDRRAPIGSPPRHAAAA